MKSKNKCRKGGVFLKNNVYDILKKHGKYLSIIVLCLQMIQVSDKVCAEEMNSTELSIMYSRDDITWTLLMDNLCDEFERKYPEIELNVMDPGNGDYNENLKACEAIDEFPDLFELQNVEEYQEAEMLGTIPESVCFLLEDPDFINDEVYSVPIYTTTYGMIYNQSLFDRYQLEKPKTYDDFLEICDTLAKNEVVPLAVGENESNIYWLDFFYHKENARRENNMADHIMDFASPDYLRMLCDYQNLLNKKYLLKDSVHMSDSQIINCLFSNDIAMYYTTPEFIAKLIMQDQNCTSADIILEETDEVKDDDVLLGWFFLPNEEGNIITSKETGPKFSISKHCEENEDKYSAAECFLKFMFEDENYREILKSMYSFQTTKKRILYPSPGIQQRLIVDYRYSQKVESLTSLSCMNTDFKKELSKTLYLLSTESITVGDAAEYLNEKQGIRDSMQFEEH